MEKREYMVPRTLVVEVATEGMMAYTAQVTNLENNDDAGVKEYSVWEDHGRRNELWDDEEEE